jgi:hypothetical protein
MEKVLSSAATEVSHDLPEPTSYRGQHIIPLAVDSDAWLTFPGLSYWLDPIGDAGDAAYGISLMADAGLELDCTVYAESDVEIQLTDASRFPDPRNPTARTFMLTLHQGHGDPDAKQLVFGTSLTFRFNYRDSRNVKDVVLPLEFEEPLVTALNKRRLCFRLSQRHWLRPGCRRGIGADPSPRRR